MRRRGSEGQLELFGEPERPPLDFAEETRLARGVPDHVRFGTSSWTFPGWGGLVYPGAPSERDLRERGLEDYARYPLFRTVGIDSSYYRPLEVGTLRRYASVLPERFRAVSKVYGALTTWIDPKTSEPNARLFDRELFCSEVLRPIESEFAAHQGPLVLEIPPIRHPHRPTPELFNERLGQFLGSLPGGFEYAVELRNRELLTPAYLALLAEHRVSHVLNFWEAMPTIGEQLALSGVLTGPSVVARLLIPPGRRYQARKAQLAPFDRIVDPQLDMRRDVVDLIRACAALGKVVYVIANNKAEGSSPLTIKALAALSGVGK